MASSGIESNTAGETKSEDNVRKTLEDRGDESSAKRMKTTESSSENAVSDVCIELLECLFPVTVYEKELLQQGY